jgi:hypothetical protein
LLAVGLVSPIGICVLAGLAGLLEATGDAGGSLVVGWIARALAVMWVLDLICLVLALGMETLVDRDEPPGPPEGG